MVSAVVSRLKARIPVSNFVEDGPETEDIGAAVDETEPRTCSGDM